MERECLDCGIPVKGRADKKFCDDQCRSNYNNNVKSGMESALRPINAILRKNHSILCRICPELKIKLKKEDLLKQGFDPNYHTHIYTTQTGSTYFFCYDYGFMKLENDMVLVVKRA